MALLVKSKTHQFVCANRDIIVINISSKNYTKTTIPVHTKENQDKHGKSKESPEDAEDQDSETESKNAKSPIVSNQIHNAVVSECGTMLAITTLGDKMLYILRVNEEDDSVTIISKREVFRVSSGLRFSPDSSSLLLADKTGGCFQFDVAGDDSEGRGKWILGHLSMVLDILMTPNQKFIITSDRDEKIRITRYPKTHVIESYCLGHSEYVSSIELLSVAAEPTLISVSGDKTLRFWNYITGNELSRVELPDPGFKLATNNSNHIAVLLLSTPIAIAFYEVTLDQVPKASSLGQHIFEEEMKHVSSILYDENNNVLVSCINENGEVLVKKFKVVDGQYTETPAEYLNDLVAKLLTTNKIENPEDVSILFKKKFDNVKSYHERKKRRIEEKTHAN